MQVQMEAQIARKAASSESCHLFSHARNHLVSDVLFRHFVSTAHNPITITTPLGGGGTCDYHTGLNREGETMAITGYSVFNIKFFAGDSPHHTFILDAQFAPPPPKSIFSLDPRILALN